MKNSELIRLNDQVIETWNNHDTEKFLTLCDDAVVWSINKGPETFKGKSQVKEYFNNWKTAFPDLKIKISNTIVGEDRISVEYEFTGTHKGLLKTRQGMPDIQPTNKKVAVFGCYTSKISNGKLIEVNNYPDRLGLINQIGVLSELHHEGAK